ncbi:MAG: hypothetical protein HRT38_02330 [Alteromonadaceae bacterium]|nr:hypothetical protein [Alteromonadaceae bacterium]
MLRIWPLLALLSSPLALANNFDDPFADDPFADDPFKNEVLESELLKSEVLKENSNHKNRVELKSYYQNNSLRSEHPFNPFNPGEALFSEGTKFISLDIALESDWQNQWKTRARIYAEDIADGTTDAVDTYLLEGLAQWQSKDRNLVIELGRSKPQWSNGYNYDIANMLQPQRTLPYIDQDNALQSKGWDMVSGQYFNGLWSFAGYLVSSDNPYIDTDTEVVFRLGYQKDDSFSLLLHKVEGQSLSFGATYSSLLTDSITLRAEWTRHSYRQTLNTLQIKQKSDYHRLVVGSTYTADTGWSLTGEYFYNEHGASKQEWDNLTLDAAASASLLRENQSTEPTADYAKGLDLMNQGWLRERYVSLMFMSMETEDLWQLRLSSQLSLDDDSQLYRFELLKSLNDNLSMRLQWQYFNGCELCEFGLNPSSNNIRLTASWLF